MSSQTPAVSVILPTYNRARLLPRAIASVLGQSFTDFELLVVDDGSSDDTERVVRGFDDPRVIFMPAERNLGDAGARNRGIERARGEWLAFQDSDDEWLPGQAGPADGLRIAGPAFGFRGGMQLAAAFHRWTGTAHRLAVGRAGGCGRRGVPECVRRRLLRLPAKPHRAAAPPELGASILKLKARSDFEFCSRLLGRYCIAVVADVLALSYETAEGISLRRDYQADIRYIVERHRTLIEADRGVAARYRYSVGQGRAGVWSRRCRPPRRLARAAPSSRPLPWALLVLSLLGSPRHRPLQQPEPGAAASFLMESKV